MLFLEAERRYLSLFPLPLQDVNLRGRHVNLPLILHPLPRVERLTLRLLQVFKLLGELRQGALRGHLHLHALCFIRKLLQLSVAFLQSPYLTLYGSHALRQSCILCIVSSLRRSRKVLIFLRQLRNSRLVLLGLSLRFGSSGGCRNRIVRFCLTWRSFLRSAYYFLCQTPKRRKHVFLNLYIGAGSIHISILPPLPNQS